MATAIKAIPTLKGEKRVSFCETPKRRSVYALTDLGKATVPIVHAMDKWGADFFAQLGVPIPCDET